MARRRQEVATDPEAEEKKKLKKQTAVWYLVISLSEITGTALLIFFACMGAVSNISVVPTHVQISFGAGTAVALALQIFGHISGGFINPTVTISAMIFGLIPITTGILYMFCQFIGSIVGYGLLVLLIPDDTLYPPDTPRNITLGFCATAPNPKITLWQAVGIEFLANAILVLLCWAVWDKRSQTSHDFIAVKFGVAVFGLVLVFGDFTGPSLNTARSFAPAIFTGKWDNQWIYWVAPIGSAVLTSFFYKYVFYNTHDPRVPRETEEEVKR